MQNPYQNLIQQVIGALPESLQSIQTELKSSLEHVLERQLQQFGLVSRQEFDIQTQVLQRTRARLDELLQRLEDLEKHHARPAPTSAS